MHNDKLAMRSIASSCADLERGVRTPSPLPLEKLPTIGLQHPLLFGKENYPSVPPEKKFLDSRMTITSIFLSPETATNSQGEASMSE